MSVLPGTNGVALARSWRTSRQHGGTGPPAVPRDQTSMSHRRYLSGFLLLTLGLSACVGSGAPAPSAPSARSLAPLVDHHQHMMSDRAKSVPPEQPPLIELPAELAAVLEARNRVVMTGEPGHLFSADAIIRDPITGYFMQGADGIDEISGMYSTDTRFLANGYTLGTDAAAITGPIRDGDLSADWLHYAMGLERDATGAWRIASETAAMLPPRLFAEEIDAAHIIAMLDDTGIERAVVLSVAYWFGEEESPDPAAQYEMVRYENDWTAAQAARYPDRLTAICGIPPLRDYAEAEIRRCASELGMPGIKMHFRSANVNLHDPMHVARVRRVFEVANELGLAIIVHAETPGEFGAYDRDEAEIFANELLPAAPDVVVQIAHMWGGNEVSAEALDVYANLVSSGDPRGRNLYFDLTEVAKAARGDEEDLALIARYAREIGMDRLLYGSDAHASPELPPSTLGWGELRRALPLSAAEFADIADNVAPYLR